MDVLKRLVQLLVVLLWCMETSQAVIKTKKLEDLANLTRLINVHRIRRLVQELTEFAPRPVGSVANEKLAVQFFIGELENIMKVARKRNHLFVVEVQRTKGSFTLLQLQNVSPFTNVYDDVQNIIVKIGPVAKTLKNNSLLINAHFDTNPGSLEASDSSANCVVMLETLRVLAHRHSPLEGFVIFLFNGASKTGLQGAHAFITQYKRATDVKAFIDLQSMGAGGQQLLYRAGPDHAWQVTAYSTAANNPFGSIIAQEIFYSGLVPSETDYRVIRDYGHIPGIGLAYIKNGYVYDTMHDTDDLLTDADLKNSAETLLNIVSYILRSPYLTHPLDLRNGKVVYFDMFGLFVVAYSQDRAFVINESIAILVLLELLFKIKKARHQEGAKSKEVTKRIVTAGCCLVLCWGATIGLNALLGLVMTASGFGLSWYRNSYWIIGLYICPAIAFHIGLNCLASWLWQRSFRLDSVWELECVFFDATRLMWSIMLLALTRASVKSAFLLTSWLLFPTLLRSLPAYLCIKKDVKYYSLKMYIVYFMSLLIPMAMSLYMARLVYVIIIPVLGRGGASINPDVIVAVVSAILVVLCAAYMATLVHVAVHHAAKSIPVFIIIYLITVVTIVSSDLGFPYTADKKYPVPQKYIIQHIQRNDSEKPNSGYWIIPLDINGPKNLFNDVAELKESRSIAENCHDQVFCGVPMYMPDFSMYKNTYFLDTTNKDEPNITTNTKCKLEAINPFLTRVYLFISGPDHMSLQIKMRPERLLMRWSLEAFIPDSLRAADGSDTYFIFYARGGANSHSSNPQKTWSFWMEINHPENKNLTDLVDVFVSRHYMHGEHMHTTKFRKFLSKFPFWTHVASWTSTYDRYEPTALC